MDNLDLYILTSIIVTLFIVFFVGIYRAIKDVDAVTYSNSGKEGGPRAALFNLMAKLFEDDSLPKEQKKIIHKAVSRTISDMESDGIYFPSEVIEKLEEQREELYCKYSGLPSVKSYGEIKKLIEK
jgi:hypothetical protein